MNLSVWNGKLKLPKNQKGVRSVIHCFHGSGLKPLANQRGQSLVGVIISAGLIGIIAMAMMSLIGYQHREIRALSEKMEVLDFQKAMALTLSDEATCAIFLNENLSNVFDSTKIGTPNLPIVNFTKIPAKGGLGEPLALINRPLSLGSPNLVVSAIRATVTAGSGNAFIAKLEVNFDVSKLARNIKSPLINLGFVSDPASPPTAKVITSCSSGGWIPVIYSYSGALSVRFPWPAPYDIWTGTVVNGVVTSPIFPPPWPPVSPGSFGVSRESPEQLCINAGYSSFTGACESWAPASPPYQIKASLMANQSISTSSGPYWGFACPYGTGNMTIYQPPTRIRCQ
jgi:hypothetical protein